MSPESTPAFPEPLEHLGGSGVTFLPRLRFHPAAPAVPLPAPSAALACVRTVLPAPAWQAAAEAHAARLHPVLAPYLERRARGAKEPVLDFLFEYYRFRPSRLLRWSPGLGTALAGDADAFLRSAAFVRTEQGIALDPARFPAHRWASVRWIRGVLAGTAERAPFLGCHGMHEWAMVYRTEAPRHPYPLRLALEALAAVVEARSVACTHFDAYRFFTSGARPLNRLRPTRATMPAMEQPGCLHTNMDLYRWAYKLYPWIPSALLADAFLLARRIREVDMRASPYDLRGLGLAPIPIETPEGRRAYRAHQQRFAREAAPLRQRLLTLVDALLAHVPDG